MIERPEGIKIASVFILSIVDHVAGVAHAAIDRAARARHRADDPLARVHRRRRPRRAINIIANRPGRGRCTEYEDKLREARETHHLTPDDPVLFLEVGRATRRSSATCCWCRACAWRLSRPALQEPGDPERDRRAAAAHPRSDRQDPARVLRMDRRQPDRLPAEVPGVRRGRHRAGDARGAAPGGAGSAAPAAGARRVGLGLEPGGWPIERPAPARAPASGAGLVPSPRSQPPVPPPCRHATMRLPKR